MTTNTKTYLRQALHAAAALLCAATLGAAQAQTAIVIGGALKFDNDAVWKRIVDEAGGPGARFAVLATASGNPARAAEQIITALQRHGALAEAIPVAPKLKGVDLHKQLHDPALIERVATAQGIFFSGGAQELIVDTLQPRGQPTEMLKAIWRVYRAGGVVAGTSAGAAIMSEQMFRDAQDNLQVLKGALREGKETDRGLGFVGPKLFIDQHFLKRGRIGRMLPMMLAKGYKLGLGVDEDSAAVLRGNAFEVIGSKGVLLVDLSEASSDAGLGAFNLRGARLSYLDRGDRHELNTGLSTPAPQKLREARIDPAAPDFKPYYDDEPFYMDMLGDSTIVHAMAHLIDSPHAELRGLAADSRERAGNARPELGFEFRLYKGAGSVGWATGAFGGEDYTVLNLRLDVTPVRLAPTLYGPLREAAR
ncbi:cyanophycinase [Paucibacter soli]|uniref:cyanophycinase n=1 Tax=Paucibacter soli TaxID=3133433 RepID=UPI0030A93263